MPGLPRRRLPYLFALFAALSFVAACDSGSPIDEPSPEDVAGVYTFTRFEFVPAAAGVLQPINVLDTLDRAQTTLRLRSGGDFALEYAFKGGNQFAIDGIFRVDAREVRIDSEREDRERSRELLLDEDFSLRRSPTEAGVLTAEIEKTVDPAAFSDRYAGIGSVDGTLYLRLVMR